VEGVRVLLRGLAVFAGGLGLEAGVAICGAGGLEAGDVLELLAHLVDKSLVVAEDADGEPRFRLLETIRAYALERLVDSGEASALRRQHAAFYLALAEESAPTGSEGIVGPLGACVGGRSVWYDCLEREHDNLRGALRWAAECGQFGAVAGATESEAGAAQAAAVGVRLGAVLWPFWLARGYMQEGREWLAVLLAAPAAAGRTGMRAAALDGAGLLAWYQGDYVAACGLHRQSLAIWRELGDKRGIAHALLGLGHAARAQGDLAVASVRYEESLAIWREVGDRWGIATSLRVLGYVAYLRGDVTTARARYEESLALLRELGDHLGMAACLAGLADVLRARRDYAAARALHQQSLTLRRQEEDKRAVAFSLARLAGVAADLGQPERAARLPAVTEALLEATGDRMDDPLDRIDYDRTVASTRAQFNAASFAAAWAEGRAMSQAEAIDYALSGAEPSAVPVAAPEASAAARPRGPLTRREREVAALIARGLTNRQIAAELVITEGTVGVHVEHILDKLVCRSRAQVAAWAVEHGLLPPRAD
jgi:DNA-binding CsgD family transcriptional regulator